MTRSALTTSVAIVASFAIGLGWSYFTNTPQSGRVAIVDLDEVAKRLGQDKEMTEELQSEVGKLQTGLAQVQNTAVQKLQQERAKLGETYSNEEAQQFLKTKNAVQLQLNQIQQRAQLQLNQSRQQLISDFRKQTQPVAAKIAKEKGFDTVVTRNDTVVFSFDESVDITEDVIKLMSAEMPARPVKAKPAASTTTPTQTQPADATETANAPAGTATN